MRFAVAGLVVIVAVIADEADVNTDKQREDEGLDETDQQLEEVEWHRENPRGDR